jgi:hypothetical protein
LIKEQKTRIPGVERKKLKDVVVTAASAVSGKNGKGELRRFCNMTMIMLSPTERIFN